MYNIQYNVYVFLQPINAKHVFMSWVLLQQISTFVYSLSNRTCPLLTLFQCITIKQNKEHVIMLVITKPKPLSSSTTTLRVKYYQM